MPVFDLRQRNNQLQLDRLSAFKTLAVMCYPTERANRERMIGFFQKEMGGSIPRRSPFSNEAIANELKLHNMRGSQTGSLLLTMVQLRLNGYEPSLRLAIELQKIGLPIWSNLTAPEWKADSHLDHLPHSREIIMINARNYRSVAHLWAAHVHSIQAQVAPRQDDLPSWPDSHDGFVRFLGYAEVFWNYEASAKPSRGNTTGSFFGSADRWNMHLPNHMNVRPKIKPLPIPRAWLDTLTTYRKVKH